MKSFWLKGLLALVAGLSGLTFDASQAYAFGHLFGGWGSSGGSSGYSYGSSGGSSGYSYGSSGGSSGYSYGSSGGSSGHHRLGLFHRHRGWGSSGGSSGYSYGSSGGSSGYSYGSSGGSSGYSHGSSGGSSGYSHGSSGGSSGYSYGSGYYGAPAAPAPGAPAAPAAGGQGAVVPAPMDAAVLNVEVPADAKVFVNNYETKSTGSSRRFVSNGLEAGKNYTYEVKAEVIREGKTVVETKTVKLQAGEANELKFAFEGKQEGEKVADQSIKTKLTLHVPADAKIFIAGREMSAVGEVREFATTKLAPGQTWSDYVVRVEVTRDGQVLSHEEKLTLVGGENRDMAFNATGANLVASK